MESNTSGFSRIVEMMPDVFDAHEFILALIKEETYEYFSLLRDCNFDFARTHAWISNRLVNNADEFSISYFNEKRVSMDIFHEQRPCAVFERR